MNYGKETLVFQEDLGCFIVTHTFMEDCCLNPKTLLHFMHVFGNNKYGTTRRT